MLNEKLIEFLTCIYDSVSIIISTFERPPSRALGVTNVISDRGQGRSDLSEGQTNTRVVPDGSIL